MIRYPRFAAVLAVPVALLFAGMATGGCGETRLPDRPSQPNIVLIMADDMGFSDTGAYGGEVETPTIDRLAREGVRFTQFYNAGRCVPSGASLMTGLYNHQAGLGHMAGDFGVPAYTNAISREAVTVPEVLKTAGYRTMMVGKWHLGWTDEGSPTQRGFDRFYGTRGYVDSYYTVIPRTDVYLDEEIVIAAGDDPVNHFHPEREWYTTDVYTDYALHFMDEALETDEPFFLYVAYNAPHFPLHAKPEDLEKYRGKYKDVGWTELRRRRYERLREMGIIDGSWLLAPGDVREWDALSEDQKDEMDLKMALYAAIIDRLDQNVGRIVEKLDRTGQLDNTLLVFLSDNGGTAEGGVWGINHENARVDNYDEWARKGGWSSSYGKGWANLSNVPFRLYKRYTHEGGIAAPLIVRYPNVVDGRGELRHTPVHITDLMATIIDLSGATYPRSFEGHEIKPLAGKSLVPVLKGGLLERDAPLFWEHEGNRAVRKGRWKIVANYGDPWALYDMEKDRTELYDLSERYPAKVEELQADYDAWAERSNVLPWSDVLEIRKKRRAQ